MHYFAGGSDAVLCAAGAGAGTGAGADDGVVFVAAAPAAFEPLVAVDMAMLYL